MGLKIFSVQDIVKESGQKNPQQIFEGPKQMFSLTVGSKSKQYELKKEENEMYPSKQRGVSNVCLSKQKICCSIDNVLRVYSFDANDQSDSD